jgi:hypothetical protein
VNACRWVCRGLLSTALSLAAVDVLSQTSPQAQEPSATSRILLRLQPAGAEEADKKALAVLMRLFEPEETPVQAGTSLNDLSLTHCGRLDENWIDAVLKTNQHLTGRSVTETMTLSLPPCPFWGRKKEVKISKGSTLSHKLLMYLGTLGQKTLGKVASENKRSLESLNDVKPDETLTLPYDSPFSSYTPKLEYREDPQRLAVMLKQIPGYTAALPQRSLKLIVAASDADCVPPADLSEWPFPTDKLKKVLEYNTKKRTHALFMAVIAVADTGIDKDEDRIFLKINDRENPSPNNIDDDENGYIDDIKGANMDRSVPGFPALYEGYGDKNHGTHVSGIALGGLKDDALTKLVKERIRIQELDLVRKDVHKGDPPLTSFTMPNDFLLDAFRYASEAAQIINLSVEDDEKSGLEEALAGTSALVIAAAGNDDGQNIDEDEKYPAAAKNRNRLITVAAYDGSGGLASFSNWGKNNVDIAAPGCQIDSILPGGKRGRINGTSQAAPLVAFTAALLYSEGLTIPQIKNRILLTTDIDHAKLGDCTSATGRCIATEGRLNIVKALDIYHDVLAIQKSDGTRIVLSGHVKNCVQLDGRCYDVGTQLKRLVHDPGSDTGQVWIKSKGNETLGRSCKPDLATNIEFQEESSTQSQFVPMTQVMELVSAVFH